MCRGFCSMFEFRENKTGHGKVWNRTIQKAAGVRENCHLPIKTTNLDFILSFSKKNWEEKKNTYIILQ